jgi:hypothetical protein
MDRQIKTPVKQYYTALKNWRSYEPAALAIKWFSNKFELEKHCACTCTLNNVHLWKNVFYWSNCLAQLFVVLFITHCHTTPPNIVSPLVEIASRDRHQNPWLLADSLCQATLSSCPALCACAVHDWLLTKAIQINSLGHTTDCSMVNRMEILNLNFK